ncbi:MAG: hypothetical protein ACP5IC_00615 [Minisyncoccia bacterium]
MKNIENKFNTPKNKNKKLSSVLIWGVVFIILLVGGSVGYTFLNKQNPSISNSNQNNTLTSTVPTSTASTKINIISFVRDGDILIADFDGKNEHKITSHPDTKFRVLISPCEFGCSDEKPIIQEKDFNNNYYSLPQLNFNKNFIAYSCLSDQTLKIIQERQKLSQPLPNPDPLSDFKAQYNLCITDLSNNKQWTIDVDGNPAIIEWSPNDDTLAVLSKFSKIHIIQRSSDNFILTKSFDYQWGAFHLALSWSPNGKILLVPSAHRKVATGYQNAETLLLLDVASGKYTDIPEDTSQDFVFFGDWLDDSNIIFPHNSQTSNTGMVVTKENIQNFTAEKVFEDKNFNWFGFINLSPNKKYAVYPSGADSTVTIDFDLTIRNMSNGQSYLLSSLFPGAEIGKKQFIEGHKWLSDNTLLFSIYGIDDKYHRTPSVIWRLNPTTKQTTPIIENAHIF